MTAAFETVSGDLRVALVGAGWWGGMWLADLPAADVTLVGIVDEDRARAEQAAGAYGGGVVAAASLRELLQATSVDAIIDATPHLAHFPVTLEALELGLPVLGEKPFASTIGEAVQLAELAERTGTLLMVSQSRSFNGQLQVLREQIAERGPVPLLSQEFFGRAGGATDAKGFRHYMADPFVTDMAIHHFDAARYALQDDPTSVYAVSIDPPWSWFEGDTMLSATFRFASGTVLSYTGSWTDQGVGTSWNADWRVSTATATLRWDGDSDVRVETPQGVETAPATVDDSAQLLVGSVNAFARALKTGEEPWGIARQNLPTMAMVHGAIESARTGVEVDLAALVERERARLTLP